MKSIFRYYLRYWYLILVIFALLFGQAIGDLTLPDYMSKIVFEGLQGQNSSLIWYYGSIMIGISLGTAAASIAVGWFSSYIGASVSRNLRADIFSHVTDFSGAEYDKLSVSTLITRSTNDITQIQLFSIMFMRIALSAPVMAVGGVIKAVQMSTGMDATVWAIVIGVAALLVVITVTILIVRPRFTKLQKLTDNVNLLAREGLNGMMVIRAFNNSEHEKLRFRSANKELTDTNLFVNRVMCVMFPMINLIMYGVIIAIMWIATVSALGGDVGLIANSSALIQYAMQIIMSFMMLVMIFIMMPRALVSMKRIKEVLNTPITIKDSDLAAPIGRAEGVIEFHDVTFNYPGSDDAALKNISFKAEKGKTTAIIGGTGSGKTTLISLIPRLYDVTEGSITLDGKDVRDITLDSLRDNIAYVPQKNVLFSGTVRDNITYAREDATDEDVRRAAQISQADKFIEEKDEGYDFEIAQGGTNVSGGQKQRIAIARAVIKNSPVYIFDDSFSALDFKTDSMLREALNANMKDAAKIIVAQRVGTIMSADNILVLDEGRIVGSGTHKELLKTCPVYHEIASSQLTAEELEK